MEPLTQQEVDFLTNFIVESDAIEGITADPIVVREQLKSCHDEGHVGALLWAHRQGEIENPRLWPDEICRIQSLITAEQHLKPGGPVLPEKFQGKYRDVEVMIGGRRGIPHIDLDAIMSVHLAGVNYWQRHISSDARENIYRIAFFHFEYEYIHPFADGNGRSGRVLTYYLYRNAGLKSFVFENSSKFDQYYPCFKDPSLLMAYFGMRSYSKNKIKPRGFRE